MSRDFEDDPNYYIFNEFLVKNNLLKLWLKLQGATYYKQGWARLPLSSRGDSRRCQLVDSEPWYTNDDKVHHQTGKSWHTWDRIYTQDQTLGKPAGSILAGDRILSHINT
jgi:hypothetical protein